MPEHNATDVPLLAKFFALARAGRLHAPDIKTKKLSFTVNDVEGDFAMAVSEGALTQHAIDLACVEAALGYQVDAESMAIEFGGRVQRLRPAARLNDKLEARA
jgi:hypothetical protein